MARNRSGNRGGNNRDWNRNSGNFQSNFQRKTESRTRSVAGRYAAALRNGDEDVLNEMTLYTQGSIGSGSGIVSTISKLGASSHRIMVDGRKATILFSNGGKEDISGICLIEVLDGGRVMSTSPLFTPQK